MSYIIMSDNFVRLCEITSYKSILWHELYLDPTGGDFQLELSADKYLKHIKKDYYIINTESEKFGIIDTFEVNDAEEGTIVTVSGLMGESILQRRIIWPSLSLSGRLDDVVAAMLRRNVISPSNRSRQISNFVYISSPQYSVWVSKQYTGANLADALVSLCGMYGHAYIVRFNSDYTGFEMQIITGKDRTGGQSVNPFIMFSAEDFGLAEFAYLTSKKAYFTHVTCAGEGYGASRIGVTYPSTSTAGTLGLNRREVFLDKQDLSRDQGEDELMPLDLYVEKLEYEAAEKLQESSTSEACEGVIRNYRHRLYEDYWVGDIVTVRNEKLGLAYDTRVLGALIAIDENGAKEVTAEMGNLNISDVSDEPQEDEIEEEEEEEPVIDPSTVNLYEDIRFISMSETYGSTLLQVDETGADAVNAARKPQGWIHIYNNQKVEVVLTANTSYYKIYEGVDGYLYFDYTLTPEQYAVVGNGIVKELHKMIVPFTALNPEDYSLSTGLFQLTLSKPEYAENEAGIGEYSGLIIAKIISGAPAGVFTLIMDYVRILHVDSIAESLSWDISAAGDGSLMAKIDTNDILTASTLTIEGTGTMKDFSDTMYPPWKQSASHVGNIQTVIIKDGVPNIGAYAFYGTKVKSAKIPDSCTYIGAYAFGYTQLVSIVIPATCKTIGEYAFAYNEKLGSVYYYVDSYPMAVGTGAFLYMDVPGIIFCVTEIAMDNFFYGGAYATIDSTTDVVLM